MAEKKQKAAGRKGGKAGKTGKAGKAVGVIPAQPTDTRHEHYVFIPLVQDDDKPIDIDHHNYVALQYEFYIPAKVWTHRAVRAFFDTIQGNGMPGATVLKTATGLWEGAEEDTNIYRAVVWPKDPQGTATIRDWLQDEIGKMMAVLAEWFESRQEEIFFTETPMAASRSVIVAPNKSEDAREPKEFDELEK